MKLVSEKRDAQNRSIIFLSLTVGLCLLVGIIAALAPGETGELIFGIL